ncbi:MAG: 3-oxoacyl-ACP synthase, partial [Oscillospiraceae bacterium]
MSFKIIGTGSALPEKIVTNDDLTKFVDTTDEWIIQRTGIKERRICTDETTSSLSTKAALNALENANIDVKNIDLIICSTIRGDYITPSLACVVAENIGATCPAFDINAACSGFIYALEVAAGFFARDTAKT